MKWEEIFILNCLIVEYLLQAHLNILTAKINNVYHTELLESPILPAWFYTPDNWKIDNGYKGFAVNLF